MKISAFGKFRFKIGLFFLFILLVFFLGYITKPPSNSVSHKIDKEAEVFFKSENYEGFENYAQKVGAKKAYDVLKAYFVNNDTKAHDFAHVVGFAAVAQSDLDGISICDNFYNYGCFHGFMQIYLQKHGVYSVSKMEDACISLGEISAPSCLHGTGHGLMMEASYDLGEALKNCEILKATSQTYCFDGVFMERIAQSMVPDEKKLKVTQANLLEPCNRLNIKYQKECWRNQVSVWFSYFEQDTTKVGSYCSSLENAFRQICFETMGLLNVQNLGEDFGRLAESCRVIDEFAYSYCTIGEVKELLFEGKNAEVARSLCTFVAERFRNECFATYERMYAESLQRFSNRPLQ